MNKESGWNKRGIRYKNYTDVLEDLKREIDSRQNPKLTSEKANQIMNYIVNGVPVDFIGEDLNHFHTIFLPRLICMKREWF